MNRYPLWKYLLVAAVLVIGIIYALPNLYGEDPALQISGNTSAQVTASTVDQVKSALKEHSIPIKSVGAVANNSVLVRFADTETQLKAQDVVQRQLQGYTVALNLAPAAPAWLRSFGAEPMYLGLDLRGGVHFLMQVDMDAALSQARERYVSDIRSLLREHKIRYLTVVNRDGKVEVKFRDAADREKASAAIHDAFRGLELSEQEQDGTPYLLAVMSKKEITQVREFAVKQNVTTLRNRVNELGVTEPVIQQQGQDRIVVQLAGVQDTARAKRILGATATLEYHMVDEEHDVQAAVAGHVPPNSKIYYDRDGRPVLLQKRVIVTGDQIIDAASGLDPQSGGPMVSVTLDSQGARKMLDNTRENVGKRMAVVFIDSRPTNKQVDGKTIQVNKRTEKVISVAVIREPFGRRFQTTGLDSTEEARNLALLLRAGALAAPMNIVEERTIGPSLGQANINQGVYSALVGFVAVVVFMAIWYKGFGMAANAALLANVVLIVALMSLLQATLTLPGIAGIVLTLGMAVDANVLIYERIREELRSGNTPQASIKAGYEKALATIADSNITTLLAAVVLFTFGTGPIKGFAVTLSIGILTSMFTAVMGTRAIVNLTIGGRRLKKLSI